MSSMVALTIGLLLCYAMTSSGYLQKSIQSRQRTSFLQSFRSGDINFKSEKLMKYFDLPVFLVVGASEDRSKFGNKVLRCMVSHKKQCIPLNKRLSEIEGIPTIDSIATLAQQLSTLYPTVPMSMVGMNLITPPAVTLSLMKQGYEIGIRNFFCQPGTVDGDIEVSFQSCSSINPIPHSLAFISWQTFLFSSFTILNCCPPVVRQ